MELSSREKIASWLLVIGLAAVFLYAAIDSFIDPSSWIGYFPHWMRGFVPDSVLLGGFSIYEILLALWLLSKKYLFYASMLAALTMFGIIVFNPSQIIVTFRDVAILFSALALTVYSRS